MSFIFLAFCCGLIVASAVILFIFHHTPKPIHEQTFFKHEATQRTPESVLSAVQEAFRLADKRKNPLH